MSDIQSSEDKQPLIWLALGDSYTIGEGVSPGERWPTLLAQRLGFAEPRYVAQTGWTSGELLAALENESLLPKYDRTSLLIGVNNQYRNLDPKAYQSEFEQLVKFARSKVSSFERILVVSIPDYSVTPFGRAKDPERISREIDVYNVINHEIAQRTGCQYCDITSISRQAKTTPSLVAGDELHPSPAMYRLWVEEILAHCGADLML